MPDDPDQPNLLQGQTPSGATPRPGKTPPPIPAAARSAGSPSLKPPVIPAAKGPPPSPYQKAEPFIPSPPPVPEPPKLPTAAPLHPSSGKIKIGEQVPRVISASTLPPKTTTGVPEPSSGASSPFKPTEARQPESPGTVSSLTTSSLKVPKKLTSPPEATMPPAEPNPEADESNQTQKTGQTVQAANPSPHPSETQKPSPNLSKKVVTPPPIPLAAKLPKSKIPPVQAPASQSSSPNQPPSPPIHLPAATTSNVFAPSPTKNPHSPEPRPTLSPPAASVETETFHSTPPTPKPPPLPIPPSPQKSIPESHAKEPSGRSAVGSTPPQVPAPPTHRPKPPPIPVAAFKKPTITQKSQAADPESKIDAPLEAPAREASAQVQIPRDPPSEELLHKKGIEPLSTAPWTTKNPAPTADSAFVTSPKRPDDQTQPSSPNPEKKAFILPPPKFDQSPHPIPLPPQPGKRPLLQKQPKKADAPATDTSGPVHSSAPHSILPDLQTPKTSPEEPSRLPSQPQTTPPSTPHPSSASEKASPLPTPSESSVFRPTPPPAQTPPKPNTPTPPQPISPPAQATEPSPSVAPSSPAPAPEATPSPTSTSAQSKLTTSQSPSTQSTRSKPAPYKSRLLSWFKPGQRETGQPPAAKEKPTSPPMPASLPMSIQPPSHPGTSSRERVLNKVPATPPATARPSPEASSPPSLAQASPGPATPLPAPTPPVSAPQAEKNPTSRSRSRSRVGGVATELLKIETGSSAPPTARDRKKPRLNLPPLTNPLARPHCRFLVPAFWISFTILLLAGIGITIWLLLRETTLTIEINAGSQRTLSDRALLVSDFTFQIQQKRDQYLERVRPIQDELNRLKASLADTRALLATRSARREAIQRSIESEMAAQQAALDLGQRTLHELWNVEAPAVEKELNEKRLALNQAVAERAASLQLNFNPGPFSDTPDIVVNAFRLALYDAPPSVDRAAERHWVEDLLAQWRAAEEAADQKRQDIARRAEQARREAGSRARESLQRVEDARIELAHLDAELETIRLQVAAIENDIARTETELRSIFPPIYEELLALPEQHIVINQHLVIPPNGRIELRNLQSENNLPPGTYRLFVRATDTSRGQPEEVWAFRDFTLRELERNFVDVKPSDFQSTREMILKGME